MAVVNNNLSSSEMGLELGGAGVVEENYSGSSVAIRAAAETVIDAANALPLQVHVVDLDNTSAGSTKLTVLQVGTIFMWVEGGNMRIKQSLPAAATQGDSLGTISA